LDCSYRLLTYEKKAIQAIFIVLRDAYICDDEEKLI